LVEKQGKWKRANLRQVTNPISLKNVQFKKLTGYLITLMFCTLNRNWSCWESKLIVELIFDHADLTYELIYGFATIRV